MSLGDKFVDEYSLPGHVGDDVYGHDLNDTDDRASALRQAKVGTYDRFVNRSYGETLIGTETRVDRLTRIVWTQKLGREQLWSVVGDQGAQGLSKGEWANPGWVLYSFLTRSTQNRVPVVLIGTSDASVQMDRVALDSTTSSIYPR